MSHNEYKNQMDYDSQSERTEEEEDEFNEVCNRGCGAKLSSKKLTEGEFDEHPDRDIGYDEDGDWFCKICREEEKVNGCEVDRCDATGKCTLDKCFYEEE